jgi:DNA-directed RNA polymerase specialized sigma24 family protein
MGSGAFNPRRKMPDPSFPPLTPLAPLNHTEAEITSALNALSDAEIRYIVGFARYRILGLRGKADDADADDLFSEAVLQTMKFKRKWKQGISFRNHIIACMRSIASNRFKQANQNTELPPDHPASPSPALERVLDAKSNVKRLHDGLRGDAMALDVLLTLFAGHSPKEAQALLHMRPKVYEAARKRISRLAGKMFGILKETPHA